MPEVEYMPTTEEIREQVAWLWDSGSDGEARAYAAFDRWLAAEKAKAWADGYGAASPDGW